MPKYCDVKPILHLLADKDLLDTVNVGAVLQALQHGLYNGEVAPVVHAHWILDGKDPYDERANLFACSKCGLGRSFHTNPPAYNYCPWCGAKMDEKEG